MLTIYLHPFSSFQDKVGIFFSKDCKFQSVTNNIPKPFEVPKKRPNGTSQNAPFWGVNVLIEGGIGGKASQEFVNRNIEILKYIISNLG